jgi:hypothetical protein
VNVKIYALVDPDTETPVYVGSSIDTSRRIREGYGFNPPLADWLASTTPEVRVLEVVDVSERQASERAWVKATGQYHVLFNKLWNGYKHSEATRRKMSAGVKRARARRKNSS